MEYKTSDLNLAAFLKAKHNFKISRLEPHPIKKDRALFVLIIENNIDIDKCVSDYFNEEDLCSVNSFLREQNDLKTWLKDYKINKNG